MILGKYIFVGDIHGHVDSVKRALDMGGHKVFVGDFVDSFHRTTGEMEECLDLVLDAIRAGEADAIYGNHELSYLMPEKHRCSGYNEITDAMVQTKRVEMKHHFSSFVRVSPEILVTHAGLSNHLFGSQNLTLDTLDDRLAEAFDHSDSFVHRIGRRRGGSSALGGTFWCHFPNEFAPVPGLTQIFGHTYGDGIRELDGNFCIDGLGRDGKFLEMEI